MEGAGGGSYANTRVISSEWKVKHKGWFHKNAHFICISPDFQSMNTLSHIINNPKKLKLDLMPDTVCSTLFCTVKFCSDYNLISSFHSLQGPTKCFSLFAGGLGFCVWFLFLCLLSVFDKYFSVHSYHKAWQAVPNSLKRETVPTKTQKEWTFLASSAYLS